MLSESTRNLAEHRLDTKNLNIDLLNRSFRPFRYVVVSNDLESIPNMVVQFDNAAQSIQKFLVSFSNVGQNLEDQQADC